MNGKPVFAVPSKTAINFDSGFKHKLLCDGPTFTLGTACAYSCSFCYVPDQMRKFRDYLSEHGVPKEAKLEDVVIRRQDGLQTLRHQILNTKQGKELRSKKLTIYASPLVDVAANMDLVNETIEACVDILSFTNWDIRLLSKSNLLPKIAQAFEKTSLADVAKKGIIYGVSTGTLDDKLAAAFEKGTAKVSKRLESLHWLQDNGYRTFGMICPSLPQNGAGEYAVFANKALDAIRADRCEHVWAEVLNVRGESIERTWQALYGGKCFEEAGLLAQTFDESFPERWEDYARGTFLALYAAMRARDLIPKDRLRFMQYVTKDSRDWWGYFKNDGAVIL